MDSEKLKVEQVKSVYHITDGISKAMVTIIHTSWTYEIWRLRIKSYKFLEYCEMWARDQMKWLKNNMDYCTCKKQWPRETTDGYYCIICEKKIK